MAHLLAFIKKFEEFLQPLVEFARSFRGFLAFSAFLIVAAIMMATLLFSQGSFDQILANFERLTPEQFFTLAFAVLLLTGGLGLSLIALSYRDVLRNSDDGYTLYVLVHEEGDPTRPISYARVALTLDDVNIQQTNERGGATFTFARKWQEQQCEINARHDNYESREPMTIELRSAERIKIPLQARSTEGNGLDPSTARVFLSYSPGNSRAAESVTALLRRCRLFVWQSEHNSHGSELGLQTEQMIRRSDCVVALVSQKDDTNPIVYNMAAFAMDVMKPVVAVRLEPELEIHWPLQNAKAIDIYKDWGIEGERLCRQLNKFINQPQPDRPPAPKPPTKPATRKASSRANPFVFGGAIRDDQFVGRTESLNYICNRLGNQLQSVSIVANRRMGKTSLLNYIIQQHKELFPPDYTWAFVYMDMMDSRTHTLPGVMRMMRRSISQCLDRDLWPERYDGNLAIMAEMFEELAETETRLVLCLDEWESIMAYPEMDSFIEQLRASGSLSTIGMVVSTAHELSELTHSGELTSPFYNIFEATYLGVMPPVEWKAIVQQAYRRSRRQVDHRELALIGALAGGHPYLTQVAGSLVWAARKNKWSRADIYRRYNLKAKPFFSNLWSRQTEAQKRALRESLGISGHRPVARDVWDGLKLRGVLKENEEIFCKPFADFIMSCEL
jgi:hypothetical protein